MIDRLSAHDPAVLNPPVQWHELASRVLAGHELTLDEGLAILRSSDDDQEYRLSAAEVARIEEARYRALGSRA